MKRTLEELAGKTKKLTDDFRHKLNHRHVVRMDLAELLKHEHGEDLEEVDGVQRATFAIRKEGPNGLQGELLLLVVPVKDLDGYVEETGSTSEGVEKFRSHEESLKQKIKDTEAFQEVKEKLGDELYRVKVVTRKNRFTKKYFWFPGTGIKNI